MIDILIASIFAVENPEVRNLEIGNYEVGSIKISKTEESCPAYLYLIIRIPIGDLSNVNSSNVKYWTGIRWSNKLAEAKIFESWQWAEIEKSIALNLIPEEDRYIPSIEVKVIKMETSLYEDVINN